MGRRLLLVHPSRMEGENRGVYEQHVVSMQQLFNGEQNDAGERWEVHALDRLHPSFPDAALRADLVIVHMVSAAEIGAVIRLRRARGLCTVYEISDNFLDLGRWAAARHPLRNPLVRQQILTHAAMSDAIQVYAPGLAELFRNIHRHVIQLDPYVPLDRARSDDGKNESEAGAADAFVIGWGGTTSHEDDLVPIAPILAAFCKRHRDATFAFMGDGAMRARLFAGIEPRQLRAQEFGSHTSYLDFVRQWDVGIAPLGRTAFNAGRTDTKFATYAACGVAALLEDSDTYRPHASRAILYRTPEEFGEALESLYADRARLTRLAACAHSWVAAERSAARLRAQRMRAYEPLLPSQPAGANAIADADVDLADGELPAPIVAEIFAEALARPERERVESLQAMVDEHPDYAQGRLLLSDTLAASGELERALHVLDMYAFPPVLAGVAAERQVALATRIRPERIAHYATNIEAPAARLRFAHRSSDRRDFLRMLLEQQPFDYIALAVALRERLADRSSHDDAELAQLCLRACMIAPEIVPPELRPAGLTRFLPE